MSDDKYPQGLKEEPIVISSPTGKVVKKFNSYAEALSFKKAFDKMRSGNDVKSLATQKLEEEIAAKEGYPPRYIYNGVTSIQNADTLSEKSKSIQNAIDLRSSKMLEGIRTKKEAYPNQSLMSKALGVTNEKAGRS